MENHDVGATPNDAVRTALTAIEPALTPGPWSFGSHSIEGPNGKRVVDIDGGPPMTVANARLIAAAPDMLAALRKFVNASTDEYRLANAGDDYICDELGSQVGSAFIAARAAIAKATGAA